MGTAGAVGARGATGATGARGVTGARGATGVRGLTGTAGATGARGLTGTTGPVGPAGADSTDANVVAAVLAADGAGSTFDADLLDGLQASEIIDAASGPQGTPITSAPFTISSPGNYFLANSISTNSNQAIRIASNDVVLNLNGHVVSTTFTGTSFGDNVIGVFSRGNITIKNGTVQGVVGTSSSAGVYFNASFGGINLENLRVLDTAGIRVAGTASCSIRIINNLVDGNTTNTSINNPDVITGNSLIDVSSCPGIIEGNIVKNGFPANQAAQGGISATQDSTLERNIIRNIRTSDGVCVRAFNGLGIHNIASRCTASGASGTSSFGQFSLEIGHVDN